MAGVYIKGMEMPKSCYDCPLQDDECFGSIKCCYAQTWGSANMRAVDCPLIPVTDRGRLGDLDRILKIIDGIWDCNDMVFKPNDHCCDVPKDCHGCKWAETKRAIREIVANAPTIIPADSPKEEAP